MHWQDIPSYLDPVLISIGSFEIRWYGMMYLVAFAIVYSLSMCRIKKEQLPYNHETVINFFVWGILSVFIGGRLGYVLFYNLPYFIEHPLRIFLPVDFSNGVQFTGIAGMSYHGGLIALGLSSWLYTRKNSLDIFAFIDFLIPSVPLGYMFGRIGNFINGELYGRVTSVPWAMYFPDDPTGRLRHPSQLYEALGEGLLLFVVLWLVRGHKPFDGFLLGLYLIGYGTVRFLIEFVREPDSQIGYILRFFTMGQMLCFIMIAAGSVVLITGATLHRLKEKH